MITLDTINRRLMADETIPLPITNRLAPSIAIGCLVRYSGGTPGEEKGAPLRTETIETILFHLRRAIEVIEAERRSPGPYLSIVVTPPAPERRQRGTR